MCHCFVFDMRHFRIQQWTLVTTFLEHSFSRMLLANLSCISTRNIFHFTLRKSHILSLCTLLDAVYFQTMLSRFVSKTVLHYVGTPVQFAFFFFDNSKSKACFDVTFEVFMVFEN